MREALDAAGDNSIRKLHWMWPPGSGKTTAIEGVIQWRVVVSPSNVLLVGQKDESAGLWAETRLHPSFKKSEAMRPFLPDNRHQNRKTTVVFPHGIYLDICGPSMTNLQEKSMPWVILEEAWQLSDNYPGRMKEAEARTHDKWNSKVFYIGQGGDSHRADAADEADAETDLFREWNKTDQREFHFECPHCQTVQPYKWNQLKWEKQVLPDLSVNWDATAETIHYLCANPECGAKFEDHPVVRRKLATSGRYIPTNPNAIKGHVGFHCNILAIWRIPWLKSVMEWEDAQTALDRGDRSLLQVFVKKRLAEFWKPSAFDPPSELVSGGYKIADYENGELIDNEVDRVMSVDVQLNSAWYSIRACDSEGNSRQLNCGQIHTLEEVEVIRLKYKVKPQCVLIDAQYRRDYVYQMCAKYGWTAYHGIDNQSLSISTSKGVISAPFSKVAPAQASNGERVSYVKLCVNPIKDVLADLRAGRLGKWEFPDDVTPEFKAHMNAERKVTIITGRDNKQVQIWQRIGKKDNHLLDTEMANTAFMMMRGHIQAKE